MTIVLIILYLILASIGDEPPEETLKFLGIFAGIEVIAVIIASITKGNNSKTERIGGVEKLLYKKGATYKNAQEYERYVAYWLEQKGFHDVRITPKSGDYGADILCKDSKGNKVAVQCKLYSKPVGYRAVQEVISGMHYYNCNIAMVVTNSTYTKQAMTAAKKVNVKLIENLK